MWDANRSGACRQRAGVRVREQGMNEVRRAKAQLGVEQEKSTQKAEWADTNARPQGPQRTGSDPGTWLSRGPTYKVTAACCAGQRGALVVFGFGRASGERFALSHTPPALLGYRTTW